jgi:hypothetical protein
MSRSPVWRRFLAGALLLAFWGSGRALAGA